MKSLNDITIEGVNGSYPTYPALLEGECQEMRTIAPNESWTVTWNLMPPTSLTKDYLCKATSTSGATYTTGFTVGIGAQSVSGGSGYGWKKSGPTTLSGLGQYLFMNQGWTSFYAHPVYFGKDDYGVYIEAWGDVNNPYFKLNGVILITASTFSLNFINPPINSMQVLTLHRK